MAEQNLSRDIVGGWAAMLQHYFVSAWIPPRDETSHYYTTTIKEGVDTPRYILGLVSTERSIKPGESATLGLTLYVGPKIQDHLKEAAPNLDLTVDYGMLTVLAQRSFSPAGQAPALPLLGFATLIGLLASKDKPGP